MRLYGIWFSLDFFPSGTFYITFPVLIMYFDFNSNSVADLQSFRKVIFSMFFSDSPVQVIPTCNVFPNTVLGDSPGILLY